MSKSTRMTAEQLRLMNLEEYEPGKYRSNKHKEYVIGYDRASPNPGWGAVAVRHPDGTLELVQDDRKHPRTPDEAVKLADEININTVKLQQMFPDVHQKTFDIAAIRALGSGTKARKESMAHLHQFAKELVENRGVDSIYIKGNVPSSKNSKEIAKFKKRVNGKLVDMASLIDSKVTAKYKKEKANTYALHKHRFLEMIESKDFPVSVQFTFIRKDIGRFDFGNAQQVVADLMVDHKWIPDDCTEYFVPVFNPVVYYSQEYCGVIIKVL